MSRSNHSNALRAYRIAASLRNRLITAFFYKRRCPLRRPKDSEVASYAIASRTYLPANSAITNSRNTLTCGNSKRPLRCNKNRSS